MLDQSRLHIKDLLSNIISQQNGITGIYDEDDVFELLKRHRLLMMSNRIFNSADLSKRVKWNNALRSNTLRSMRLAMMLVDIIRRFKQNNITATSLKGPLLGSILYDDIGERHFVDLDILIVRNDLQKAINIACAMGFSLAYPKGELSSRKWKYYFKWKNDVGLIHKEKNIFIELHIGIYYHDLLKNNLQYLFLADKIEESLGGEKVKCLNRSNMFLYLTYHGGLHQYVLLFWLRDVSEAIIKWDLDHASILHKAKLIGIERLLGVSLILAQEIFQSDIPQSYLDYLEEESSILNRLSRLCYHRINGEKKPSLITKIRGQYYFFLLKPGIKYKWKVFQSLFHRWYIGKFMR